LANTYIHTSQTLWLVIFTALGTEQLDYIAEKRKELFGVYF
jgi:CDP-6-deoxy-D-xylo-4-hexulose-3-dehydrase